MKVLVFGAQGQVGTDCCLALDQSGFSVSASCRGDTDFADAGAVSHKVSREAPDFVVNACAYTAVDKAESEPSLANKINHLSVSALAKACQQLNIPLLHLSTDYVFNGQAEKPYLETDTVDALGVYGSTKLAGEQAIQREASKHIILRTSWVFGEHGNNFVKTMLRLGADRDELNIVADQFGRPSYAGDIVSAILFFVTEFRDKKQLPWGIYHCSSEGETNWCEFAGRIFECAYDIGLLSKSVKVNPIPASEYPTPAPRPSFSVLNTHKLESLMAKPMPHWQMGLDAMLSSLSAKRQ